MRKKAVYWKIREKGKVDFIFLNISRFADYFSGESEYIKEIKVSLGLDAEKEHDFVLTTNRNPDVRDGKIDGGTTVSFGEIEMDFMSSKEAVRAWLNKFEEYEITIKF